MLSCQAMPLPAPQDTTSTSPSRSTSAAATCVGALAVPAVRAVKADALPAFSYQTGPLAETVSTSRPPSPSRSATATDVSAPSPVAIGAPAPHRARPAVVRVPGEDPRRRAGHDVRVPVAVEVAGRDRGRPRQRGRDGARLPDAPCEALEAQHGACTGRRDHYVVAPVAIVDAPSRGRSHPCHTRRDVQLREGAARVAQRDDAGPPGRVRYRSGSPSRSMSAGASAPTVAPGSETTVTGKP